jgi:two-component system cell cycle sensor histidine kinase/response regulator CckA
VLRPILILRPVVEPALSSVVRRVFALLAGLLSPPLVAAVPAEVRVGIELNSEPLSFATAGGRLDGFNVDLIRAVAGETGLKLRPIGASWNELFGRFKANELDVLVSVAYTRERDQIMDFTATHLTMGGAVFSRRGGLEIHQGSDLGNVRVAVQPESFTHAYLRRHGWDRNLVFFPTLREALHALEEGRCDAVAAISVIGMHMVQQDRLTHVVNSGVALSDLTFELHLAVHAGDADLLYTLNEGLARMRANGEYDRIHEKWIGPLEGRHLAWKDVTPYLPVLVLGLGAGLGIVIWQRRIMRRLAAQAHQLRESEERLRHVFEGSEDGFWDWDLATGKLERSERWAAMLGYTLAEIGPTLAAGTSLVHPDDLEVYQLWQRRLERGGVDRYDIEYRMRTKSGEWLWILDRGKVVARDARGNPMRMAGTHTDITARKRTDAALIESQAQLKRSAHLLEQAQAMARMGGWEYDLRSDRLYWTRETYRLHETTPEEFQPTMEASIAFYAPGSRSAIRSAIEHAARSGQSYALELDVVTARSRPIRVRTTGAAERDGQHVVKIYGTFQDITAENVAEAEREKLRLKMLEAQKLESLGVLAGGIAHDFNNLLTVILANATFVRSDSAVDDERLAHIESAARRAADLCRQMLAYAGKGSFVVEHADLGALVRDTAELIRVSISKKARLELDLSPRLPAVQGDVSQLRQVVMNLVINASEALGEAGGEIRITTRTARPEPTTGGLNYAFDLPAGDCVCLEITDTGQGMTPATLGRIFDPFFTTKFAGRGLGLAAVLGIVRAHNGALTVRSALGQGSTFSLYLPASTQAVKTPTASAAAVPTRNGHGTILIADDEPVVLTTAAAVLRHHGYETVLATDGHEAVREFKADPRRFAAVLLDLTMPGLDGAEVLRVIRAVQPKTRVLMMSGFSEQDVLNRLRGLGEVAILRKPFTQDTLLARIGEVASG